MYQRARPVGRSGTGGVRLLTAAQLEQEYNIRRGQAFLLAREGILPHVRLGRQVRFDRAAIEAFLANGGRSFEGGWKRTP
jgi:excisionase family DNA binding protein